MYDTVKIIVDVAFFVIAVYAIYKIVKKKKEKQDTVQVSGGEGLMGMYAFSELYFGEPLGTH